MSGFKLGATYKMAELLSLLMEASIGATFKSGEEHTFTVHQLEEDGSVYTDDITSPAIKQRCQIPAHIFEDCTEVLPCK